jgi:threonine dehydratase
MNSIADGVSVGIPGSMTFGIISQSKWVDQVLTVSEDSICQAILRLMTRNKVVVEPAGSVACAALIQYPHLFTSSTGPVVVTLSGGNIEPLLLMRIMQHGLISYGRYLTLQIRTSDKPGKLAGILNVIASQGANVTARALSRSEFKLLTLSLRC